MKPPLLIRALPPSLRISAFYRLYRPRRQHFAPLYDAARLYFAPEVSMRLMPFDEGHSCIAFTGIYELDLTRRIVDAARRGGTLVDVGANFGYYSLLWASGHAANRVVAYEASPRNVAHLEGNIETNGLASRIEIRRCALGRAPGRMPFDVGPAQESGWGGLAPRASAASVEVEVRRLDDEALGDTEIAVLKIDVEGADTWVLQGAESLLRRRRIKLIFYEQNRARMRELGIELDEAQTYLRSLGYSVAPMSNPAAELVEFVAQCP